MAKNYNRKRLLEENATDNSPSLKKVNFEKSNRQKGKKEIKQEIELMSKNNRKDLIWEAEIKLAMECEFRNTERRAKGLPEECNCPLPEKMTDEELEAIIGSIIVSNEDFDQIQKEIENPSDPNEELKKLLKNKPTDN
jgi:hypothetical protein